MVGHQWHMKQWGRRQSERQNREERKALGLTVKEHEAYRAIFQDLWRARPNATVAELQQQALVAILKEKN
jgi:hypothetical protein